MLHLCDEGRFFFPFNRELREECGLVARSLRKHGTVWFDSVEESSTIAEVHLFTVDDFEGEISESDGE